MILRSVTIKRICYQCTWSSNTYPSFVFYLRFFHSEYHIRVRFARKICCGQVITGYHSYRQHSSNDNLLPLGSKTCTIFSFVIRIFSSFKNLLQRSHRRIKRICNTISCTKRTVQKLQVYLQKTMKQLLRTFTQRSRPQTIRIRLVTQILKLEIFSSLIKWYRLLIRNEASTNQARPSFGLDMFVLLMIELNWNRSWEKTYRTSPSVFYYSKVKYEVNKRLNLWGAIVSASLNFDV